MSFRVKSTHQLLQNTTPPKQDKQQVSFFDQVDEKGEKSYLRDYLPKSSKTESRPKETSTNGIAIRTITSAQADHM